MSAIDELSRKFVSGNNVPVERASFTREEWARVVDERDQLRERVAELEAADAGSAAMNGFYCYMIEKTSSIPIGAEDNQRGASTYNWYRHFAQMVWDYMDQRANHLESGQ